MKKALLAMLTLFVMVVATACGGNDDAAGSGDSGPANTVTLEASNWEFDKEEYTVPAGKVTLDLKNVDGYHGITVDGTDIKIDGDGKATANLKAGEYTIRCSIICGEGHTEMVATLIVQ
ncbi:hypothetical protein GCM10008967_20700 [Bacillus carboniphilus]|uniref:Cytochrome C oxidase subunit II n=1 Tax=Bacillus carboniphilus TaxID=86663 RepID=A0ABN0W9P4_9BACI